MNLNVSAPPRSHDSFFESCMNLHVKATRPEELQWMAALARVLAFGGELTITPKGKESITIAFNNAFEPDATTT